MIECMFLSVCMCVFVEGCRGHPGLVAVSHPKCILLSFVSAMYTAVCNFESQRNDLISPWFQQELKRKLWIA